MLKYFLNGVIIGGTLSVPGASGASMAIILGIYHDLMEKINAVFYKEKRNKNDIIILSFFSMGCALGIVLFSGAISYLLREYPSYTKLFFVGVIVGGVPLLFKELRDEFWNAKNLLYVIMGLFIVIAISLFPKGNLYLSRNQFFSWVISGMIASIALILPGISVSHFLLTVGIYDVLLSAITEFEYMILIPFGVGLSLGVILVSRIVATLLQTHRSKTYLVIVGFVAGSIGELLIGVDYSAFTFGWVLSFALGFIVIWIMGKQK